MEISGKRIVITGANRGLGRALAADMSRGFELPKISTTDAVSELLEAIAREDEDAPIGAAARHVFAELVRDPRALQRAFYGYGDAAS